MVGALKQMLSMGTLIISLSACATTDGRLVTPEQRAEVSAIGVYLKPVVEDRYSPRTAIDFSKWQHSSERIDDINTAMLEGSLQSALQAAPQTGGMSLAIVPVAAVLSSIFNGAAGAGEANLIGIELAPEQERRAQALFERVGDVFDRDRQRIRDAVAATDRQLREIDVIAVRHDGLRYLSIDPPSSTPAAVQHVLLLAGLDIDLIGTYLTEDPELKLRMVLGGCLLDPLSPPDPALCSRWHEAIYVGDGFALSHWLAEDSALLQNEIDNGWAHVLADISKFFLSS